MAVELQSVQKPLRRLRKALKDVPKDPSAEEVHHLRTQTRRLEAIVVALRLEKESEPLFRTVTPIRKAAGKVRDMDVLTKSAVTLTQSPEDECLVRLLEHLGALRLEGARKLHEVATDRRRSARRELKRCVDRIEDRVGISGKHAKRVDEDATLAATSVALSLTAELTRWPRLNKTNLHAFRLKVKTLRYILELANDADATLLQTLKTAKDVIGDWHDWQELGTIARDVLDCHKDCLLVRQIQQTAKEKLALALSTANTLRENDLTARKTPPKKKKPGSVPLSAAAQLAG